MAQKKRQTSIDLPLSIVPLDVAGHAHEALQFNAACLRREVANRRAVTVFVIGANDRI